MLTIVISAIIRQRTFVAGKLDKGEAVRLGHADELGSEISKLLFLSVEPIRAAVDSNPLLGQSLAMAIPARLRKGMGAREPNDGHVATLTAVMTVGTMSEHMSQWHLGMPKLLH
jgi:hypothetical protein